MAPTASSNSASPAPEKPTVASRQPLYEASTQHKHWHFAPGTLASMRREVSATAAEAIRNAFEADIPGSSSEITFLTAEDELALVKLYIGKVGPLCGHFRFPEDVEATAISFIKRFYLNNTVMDWHPKNVMLTTLFLATKTTNHPIALDTYASHIPKTTPADVLNLEFLVAQSLSFEFHIWHAHRALWGLYLDLQTSLDLPVDSIKDAYFRAEGHIRKSRLTDAELIYPPSQIALASLYMASSTLAEQYLTAKALGHEVLDIIKSIAEMVTRDGVAADVDAVREIDKRLKICKNPEKVVGSKAYIRKQEQIEAEAAAKRTRKALQSKSNGDVNPFGDDLSMSEVHGIAAEAAKVDAIVEDEALPMRL